MVQIQKINENHLDRLLKEVTVLGEEIRSMQDEKQSVMDEFRMEYQRFKRGQISEQAFATSTKKVTSELAALDAKIRNSITNARQNARKTQVFIDAQRPEKIRASSGGLRKVVVRRKASLAKAKPKKARKAKRRPARRKPARKAKAKRKPARKVAKRVVKRAAKRKRVKAKKKSAKKRKG